MLQAEAAERSKRRKAAARAAASASDSGRGSSGHVNMGPRPRPSAWSTWNAAALRALPAGICAPTVPGGDCHVSDSGSWQHSNLVSCVQDCSMCERCNYISFSAQEKDCSWFHACDESALITESPDVSTALIASFRSFAFDASVGAPGAVAIAETSFTEPDFGSIASYCPDATGGIAAHRSQEVGLHCGHSATMFLEQDSRLHYTSFSLNGSKLYSAARSYLRSRYGDRVTFVEGDSRETIPHYIASKPELRCDIVSIDGRHRYSSALQDALHLLSVARCDGIIFMDDVCDPAACHAHTANGHNQPYVIGPTQAWAELKRLGLVKELHMGTVPDRGWVHGSMHCRDRPRVRPPRVRFLPNRPTEEQRYVEGTESWSTLQHVFKVPPGL